jgi:hypothetical protein
MHQPFFDNLPDLDTAITSGKEYDPLAYNEGDYPTIEDMFSSPQFISDHAVTIDLMALAQNGTVLRDDMDKYHANKKYNSSTALKEVLKTPFHWFFYTNQKEQKKDKKHFELGTFAHMAFLEPECFDKFIIEKDFAMNTTEGVTGCVRWFEKINKVDEKDLTGFKIAELRAYVEELRSSCPYQLIKEEHQIIIDAIRYNYQNYGGGIISRILKGATSEVSFYGKDSETGLPVKVRPDYFNIEENIGVNAVISFKTTSAQSLGKFLYDSAKYQYELSEGMYQQVMSDVTGRKFNVTIMIMMQTVPPYLPAVFWWTPEDIQNGKYKYRFALDTLDDCLGKKSFPGFDVSAESGNYGVIQMPLPDWSQKLIHPVDIDE